MTATVFQNVFIVANVIIFLVAMVDAISNSSTKRNVKNNARRKSVAQWRNNVANCILRTKKRGSSS